MQCCYQRKLCVTLKLHLCQSHAACCIFLRSRPFCCLYCCTQHHPGNVYEHTKHSSAFDCKNSPFANSSLMEIPFFANHKQGHLIKNQVRGQGMRRPNFEHSTQWKKLNNSLILLWDNSNKRTLWHTDTMKWNIIIRRILHLACWFFFTYLFIVPIWSHLHSRCYHR